MMKQKYDFDAWDFIDSNDYSSHENCLQSLIDCVSGIDKAQADTWHAELDGMTESELDYSVFDFQDEIIDWLNDNAIMPPYCYIGWNEGDLRCYPYIDDSLPVFDDYQEQYTGDDVILIVNDHGNTTCQQWNGKEYVTEWDMV